MAANLHAVSETRIEELRRDSESVARLPDEPVTPTFFYHYPSINYFLTGDAYPAADDHKLASLLFGKETIDCPSLENGNFGIVSPKLVEKLARRLAEVDLKKVKARIKDADLEDLADEEELDDLDDVEPDEAADEIADEIKELTAFYAEAAAAGLGVVMYTG